MLVVPRACPGEPHAADVQCPGIWDWCDGQSTNCDYPPIDNAWYFWALNSTVEMVNAVDGARTGGEVSPSELATLEQRAAGVHVGFNAEFWDTSCNCYRSEAHKQRPGGEFKFNNYQNCRMYICQIHSYCVFLCARVCFCVHARIYLYLRGVGCVRVCEVVLLLFQMPPFFFSFSFFFFFFFPPGGGS